MTFPWVELLTFASATACFGGLISWLYQRCFRYQAAIEERFQELTNPKTADTAKASTVFRDLRKLRAQAASVQSDLYTRWAEFVEQSGLEVTVRQLAIWSAGMAVIFPVVMLTACCSLACCLPWYSIPISSPLGLLIPYSYVHVRRSARIHKLCLQLPEAFDVMNRAIRAGQTVPAAMQIIANDFDSPISDEFMCCYEQQNLGMSMESALRNLARRTGVMELRIFVVALLVQCRGGGNLVEILNTLSDMTRKRLWLHSKVLALTGEGRMQANVLMVLPFVAFLALLVMAPNYVSSLLRFPRVLMMTALAQVLGCLWIRRIVNFDF
ncbi:MAG: type II secretion system F family protein [Planctomycetes bacterium]|nr:type II secretion system F family protein [Planctomycetota bacterium]